MTGKWITTEEFADIRPRDVFHRDPKWLAQTCRTEAQNRHILFRRRFSVGKFEKAVIRLTADDYYKLYLNGTLVTMGPAPCYPSSYGLNTVDVTEYLREGENTLAVHTLYQGLINRTWVSGDLRHGLFLELELDGETVLVSDESFRAALHTGYSVIGIYGYDTQFAEAYDSRAPECGFERPEYDDSGWEQAKPRKFTDYILCKQTTAQLTLETIRPTKTEMRGSTLFADFGSCYVGYLNVTVCGSEGQTVTAKCAQELNTDGSARWQLRASKCDYREPWILRGGQSVLDWFDYKSFRYVELDLPEGCVVTDLSLTVRHYPFTLRARLRPDFAEDENLRKIWELCVHTLHYGAQEVIPDCMERERGCYIADSSYTSLAHFLLTGDGSLARKLIDDAFASSFITETLGCCTCCSFIHNVAEYPLMLARLVLWIYRLTGDRAQLAADYENVTRLLDGYRRDYERDGQLCHMDKWCVVEWPKNYRDGYDVELPQHETIEPAHIAQSAHYYETLNCANRMAEALGLPPYRDTAPMKADIVRRFFDPKQHLFCDREDSAHTSYIGNIFALAYGLSPDAECTENIEKMILERGISQVNIFGTFPVLYYFTRTGQTENLRKMLLDDGAWLRMLREGATTTFEAWGRDTKWNTSLFHNTPAYGVIFLTDADLPTLFE